MLVEPTQSSLLYVVSKMRDLDWKEISALRWTDSRESLAMQLWDIGPPFWMALTPEQEPAYVWGVAPSRPGVWQVWGFGTDKFPAVLRPVTRWMKKTFVPVVGSETFHRVECFSLAEKVEARKWLRRCFGGAEQPLPKYGKHGEDFVLTYWV